MLTFKSQSSNSESSSSISSPEHAAGSCSSQCVVGPCSPLSSGDFSDLSGPTNLVSYLQINRILKEAHFQSLQNRGQLRDTWWLNIPLWATRGLSPRSMSENHKLNHFTQLFPSHLQLLWDPTTLHAVCVVGDYLLVRYLNRVFIIQINQGDNHFSNNNSVAHLHIICDLLDFWPVLFSTGLRGFIVGDEESLCFVFEFLKTARLELQKWHQTH